jgi:hypothetical protein
LGQDSRLPRLLLPLAVEQALVRWLLDIFFQPLVLDQVFVSPCLWLRELFLQPQVLEVLAIPCL